MNSDFYQRTCDLFLKVCQLPVHEQDAFLTAACAGDANLLRHVQEMLLEDAATDTDEPEAAIHRLLLAETSTGAIKDTVRVTPEAHRKSVQKYPSITGFTITEKLGQGGMGIVYRALQHSTDREVALKTLPYGRFTTENHIERFEREVKLAASLNYPGISQIYDSGQCEGMPWLAMELVNGVDLTAWLRAHELDDRSKVRFMATVCAAVAYAHGRGIIHRDLKPGNILVTDDGRPCVVDFGLARILDGDYVGSSSISVIGDMLGTPGYMSPEQARGEGAAIDGRSDCYSLGVILYELLTGQPARDVNGPLIAVIRRIADTELPSPRTVRSNLDRDLESIVMKAVSPRPEDRYRTVEEFGQDLHRFLSGQTLIARRHSRRYVMGKWLVRHHSTATTLVSVGCIVAAAVGYHFRILRAERERITVETTERFAAIPLKTPEQPDAERGTVKPGAQNNSVQKLSPGVSALESVSATRTLFDLLFEPGKYEARDARNDTSPIRYYSGNRIGDGIAGVRHNKQEYTAGIAGTAFSFDGKPHCAVNIPADDMLNDLNSGTIDAWIKTPVYKDPMFETQAILFKEWAFNLCVKHGQVMTFDWGSETEFMTDVFVADGKWHHIAMSFRDGGPENTVLYVDGVEAATATTTINRSRQRGLVIGSWEYEAGSFCNFVGAIDEVHIWNRVLTSAEIADLIPRNDGGQLSFRDNRIDDGSFESRNVASVSVLDQPMLTSWRFRGSAGIAHNDSVFGNGTAPDGAQIAYIQKQAEIISTFELSREGDYRLTLLSKGREHYEANPIEVVVDGVVIATVVPASNTDYTPSSFSVPGLKAGAHDISFRGVNFADATTFIDAVSLAPAVSTSASG